MAIKLFDFQQEAVKRALAMYNFLMCVRVGGGKTLIAMCYAKLLLKRMLSNKIVFACTVSAASAVHSEFLEKIGLDVPTITEVKDFFDYLLDENRKVAIIKHSFFEKLGYDQAIIDDLRDVCERFNLKVSLIIDEAHKLSNEKSIAHTAYQNIRFMFNRVLLLTATPYTSGLEQIFGTISLIQPKLWKSRAEFTRNYIDQQIIMQGGKVRRKETMAYKNLSDLRKKISPFTYFYYPKIKLNFFQHTVKLKDYTDYYAICKGVLTANELERVEKGEKKDA